MTTDFLAVGKVNGKSVCLSDVQRRTSDIDLNETGSAIKNIQVKEPKPKNDSDTYIRVVYNGRQDDSAAYNFTKATDCYIDSTRFVKVFYPFSVEIELAEGFTFDGPEPVTFDSTFNLSLMSDVVEGGEVHFNTAMVYMIDQTVENNILKLDFSYSPDDSANYWGVEMPLTSMQAEGYFDFHLNFQIHYQFGEIKGLTADIVVSSEDTPQSSNRVKIKQSRILWGCLGKDTLITLADGTRKKVMDLQVGDYLLSDHGPSRLVNIVRGIEEKVIAVGVSDERTLYLTKKHPVATERGLIAAEKLTAGDRLRLENGEFEDICYLEEVDYGDKVYSPELEQGGLISAEGIWVGDFLTTPDPIEEAKAGAEPLEQELVDELIRWTELKDRQIRSEVNV